METKDHGSIPRAKAQPQAHTSATCRAPTHAQECSGSHAHTCMRGSGITVPVSFISETAASNPDST